MRDTSRPGNTPAAQFSALPDPVASWLDSLAEREGSWITARWEDQLAHLLERLGLPTEGVVQIGAHVGQEVQALSRCGFRRLVMVEPNPDHAAALWQQLQIHLDASAPAPADGLPAAELVPAAAGRERGELVLHVTEHDQQASLLVPMQPMAVVRQETVPVLPVRDVQAGCNVLVIDAQGAELEVLAGADLSRLQLAVVEASTSARYRGGATVESVSDYMRSKGWRQIAGWAHVRPHVVDVAWLAPARQLAAVSP